MDDGVLGVAAVNESKGAIAMAGTMRALLNNLIVGVSTGFQKKARTARRRLSCAGSGQQPEPDTRVSLIPVVHKVPDGITVETPSQTEILVSGSDKQVVGQVAADIRSYRPPEPYKGKGVRYADEHVVMKEAKKK